ncbi:MAG TPA: prolyl oligopeptidase family serine peptidase [Bryobacteraceae bacterium]|nr:prolyl oligopeptidase family serine peptidase [Bryobacteraceae bacterium]
MHRFRFVTNIALLLGCAGLAGAQNQPSKTLFTLDEFFDAADITHVRISPDGRAVAIETSRADWDENRFRTDLWLYRDEAGGHGSLVPLTQSGHDHNPEWSPDGRWIAFLSDRPSPAAEPKPADDASEKPEKKDQVYAIRFDGGEAFPVTRGDEEVHAFAWSGDSRLIYFVTRTPWTKEQQEAYKKAWKDVVQFRESERGDVISRMELAGAVNCATASGGKACDWPAGVQQAAATPLRVKQLETSPDGKHLAFLTESPSQRWDSVAAYGIYLVDATGGPVQKLVQREAFLENMRWASDSRHIFFSFTNGSVEGAYLDAQQRVYWVGIPGNDTSSPSITRWAAAFTGAVMGYSPAPDGGLLALGMMGTEVQPYSQTSPAAEFSRRPGLPGTYERLSTATRSGRVAFVHSSLGQPPEVYLAESSDNFADSRPITSFNRVFTERALPQGRPYRWTTDDGVTAEGMLIYPPGKFESKHLRMLTLIHGGPEDADGNHFGAGWYQWGAMAATKGWLVFEPNYRGSVGYGDQFALGIVPKIVSRPGKDILEGVDALVKDGIADPDHLTIGGYSYGGYMTNWLITQTTRFKAAVSGAGAVEHVANWGNDDTTFDDAYFLGGNPWEAKQNFDAEAAIWRIDRVKTPTHIVAGADDVRVYVGEQYLLERALKTLGVPAKLLIFPGEGHELDKNPWHGKIKVREELKWLEEKAGGQ